MNSLYEWVVFLHILGVFGFLFAHGTSAFVTFRLKAERNVERIRSLLDLSFSVALFTRISLLVLLVAGIALGFMGGWWGHGWIWTALALFIVISVSMGPLAQGGFTQLRELTNARGPKRGQTGEGPVGNVDEKKIEAATAKLQPVALTAVGLGGITIILWLMMFKPF